jgi:ubiquinone/menaquinone biosynthesis C-methylase UbiE
VLDPAAGYCEFISTIPAAERWAVDQTRFDTPRTSPGIRLIVADIMQVDLPEDYFDAVFVSNFLEHLPTQEDVARFLDRIRVSIRPGGRIAVMGPNYRYCARTYWDCADH